MGQKMLRRERIHFLLGAALVTMMVACTQHNNIGMQNSRPDADSDSALSFEVGGPDTLSFDAGSSPPQVGTGGAVGSGGAVGTGGLTTVVSSGGSATGGSNGTALGGAGAVATGGAGGVGGSEARYSDAGVPDAPDSGGAPGTGGALGSGGAPGTGGTSESSGETSTGGATGTGGAAGIGGGPGTGGVTGTGGAAGTGGGPGTGGSLGNGGSNGSGGSTVPVTGPCDIYAAASPATPCVAAYSMVRVLSSTYRGPLYQVRRGGGSNNTGTGGTTTDIGVVEGGFADAAAQDTACGTEVCTVSMLYDQSGKGNHLKVAPASCSTSTGTALEPDYESNAEGRSLMVGGHKVYALYMKAHDGYRNNQTTDMPTGNAAQGIYEVADGRKNVGTGCCWDFGNASADNCYGSMAALLFGMNYWGTGGDGNGPWFMGDSGTWLFPNDSGIACGASSCINNPSMNVDYAFGVLATSQTKGAIRVGNAQSGGLTTAYDGQTPKAWSMGGGIVLGIRSDNSNSSFGTFFEGAITSGQPMSTTDEAVLRNVQAAGYGR